MNNPLRSPVDELDHQLYIKGLMTPADKADLNARAAEMAGQMGGFIVRRLIGHQLGLLDYALKCWSWVRSF